MGVERRLKIWSLSSLRLRTIRTLTRERQQLIKERSIIKNQIHAGKHKAEPLNTTLLRMSSRLDFISSQVNGIENEIKDGINNDESLKMKLEKIMTIPDLSFISIITVIAETKGFVDITSIKQLSSYAGYDVSIRESGKWRGGQESQKKVTVPKFRDQFYTCPQYARLNIIQQIINSIRGLLRIKLMD